MKATTFAVNPAPMKKMFSFRLDPDLIEKLRKIAEKQNRSLANLIETILKEASDTNAIQDNKRP